MLNIRSDIFLANANEKSIGYFSEPLFNTHCKFLTCYVSSVDHSFPEL